MHELIALSLDGCAWFLAGAAVWSLFVALGLRFEPRGATVNAPAAPPGQS